VEGAEACREVIMEQEETEGAVGAEAVEEAAAGDEVAGYIQILVRRIHGCAVRISSDVELVPTMHAFQGSRFTQRVCSHHVAGLAFPCQRLTASLIAKFVRKHMVYNAKADSSILEMKSLSKQ